LNRTIRLFLLLEGVSFVLAALVHLGMLVSGYEHRDASFYEGTIGAVLLLGWALTWVLPAWSRTIAIAAQGFALLGTTVGTYLAVVGVGPHTVPDVVYHVGIWLVLAWGLVVAARAPADAGRPTPAGG
jgi:hypothetical protein